MKRMEKKMKERLHARNKQTTRVVVGGDGGGCGSYNII